MSDTQPQDTPASSPDIGSMLPADDKSITGLVSGMTDLYRQKSATDTKLSNEFDVSSERDRKVREAAFNAEGVAANNTPKPWDADKEHKKFAHDPIEGFGSAGGLFAMIASAFTRAPMENAINGMAGAINSLKEGKEEGYKRAFDSFKENVKLAEHRFKMQHELYNDALSMSTVNASVSNIKFRNAATKFGDQQMLMLAEAGMVDKIYEALEARSKSNEQAVKAADALTESRFSNGVYNLMLKDIPQGLPPAIEAAHKLAAWNKAHGITPKQDSPEQAVAGRIINENPKATGEELAQKFKENGIQVGRQPERDRIMQERVYFEEQAIRDREGREPTAAESAKIRQDAAAMGRPNSGTSGNPSLHPEKVEIDRRTKQYTEENIAKGMDPDKARAEGYTRAAREVAAAGKTPSGNAVMQLDAQYQKAERMEHAMDQMEELMLKHKFITGLGGTITRPVEAFSNILGSNATDRKQFQRFATELKERGLSVVNDRTGRPLSSEAKDAAVIFAGLNPQDTGANTIRAIVELRPVIQTIKEQIKARGTGKGPVSGGSESPPPPKTEIPDKDAPWRKDPTGG